MSKRRVILLLSLTSLIIIILLGALAVNRVRVRLLANLVSQYYLQQQVVGEEVANLLKTEIISLQDKLYLVSDIPSIRFPTDTESCNLAIRNSQEDLQVKANNIGRVGADGNFICSLNAALIGAKASNFGRYIDTIFNDPEHKPVMSRAVQVPGVQGFVFAVHIPVYDEAGNFNGTLGSAIYFNQLRESYLENVQFANDGYAVILDDNYDLLYHPRTDIIGKNFFTDEVQALFGENEDLNNSLKAAVEQGEIGQNRYDLEGSGRIAAIYPTEIFPGRTWVVAVVTPITEVEDAVINSGGLTRDFAGLILFLFILIATTPLLILYYLNRSLFRPLAKVTESIKKISAGDFDQKLAYTPRSAADELGQLTTSFNKMAAKLKDLYANLNQRVKEQTEELVKEKNSLEVKVAQRTAELAKAKDTLEAEVEKQTAGLRESLAKSERFNRILIDRELQMVQLKQRVQELEGGNAAPDKAA